MDLVVVESPTKAKTISKFLGKDYLVLPTMGHIRDLPKSKLGVDVKNNFKPQYVIVPGQEKVVNRLKKEAKSARIVYLAVDPDREGEAIAYHVAMIGSGLKSKASRQRRGRHGPKFLRIVFHEITESAVKKALAKPGAINKELIKI